MCEATLALSMSAGNLFAQDSITPDVDFVHVGYANVTSNLKTAADFFDNPDSYVGKTIQMLVVLRARDNLRQCVGFLTPFSALAYAPMKTVFYIKIPTGMKVPNAVEGDFLKVIFRCDNGLLEKGNVALAISRE
jgi:hypothetical protein